MQDAVATTFWQSFNRTDVPRGQSHHLFNQWKKKGFDLFGVIILISRYKKDHPVLAKTSLFVVIWYLETVDINLMIRILKAQCGVSALNRNANIITDS